ncbi:AMMECR1 domain-containing protein, partial [Armillaria luteobubalina]
LKGYVDNFDPLPLHDGLAEYALISAFRGSRFGHIARSELASLECGISLPTDFEHSDSYIDWTIGVHGIYITRRLSRRPTHMHRLCSQQSFSATYLPDVIPEQGWDKIEAVDSAIHKAGWNGRITEDLRRSVTLRRYPS